MAYITRFAIEFLFLQFAQRKKTKKYYQQATYEDTFPKFPQPSAMLLFQEIDRFNAIVTTRFTYNESLKIFPRQT